MTHESALDTVRAFVALTAAAAVVVLVSRRLRIPDELGLLVAGLASALLFPRQVVVTPELVLGVLLPGLVFEASYRLQFDELRRSLWAVILLAVPGVLLSALVVAIVLANTVAMPFAVAFLIGAMVSATDPASVTAAFARLRAPAGLATVVQAESLLNDGTGLVLFVVAAGLVRGELSVGGALVQVLGSAVGSTLIGAGLGFIASRVVALIDDFMVEITVAIALAYGSYLAADAIGLSGVIATVMAGVTLGNYGRRVGMSRRTRDAIDIVGATASFILTALVFLLVGIAIRIDALLDAAVAIAWATLAVVIGRAVVVYALVGLVGRGLRVVGRRAGIPMRWRHVMFWSGLRGAVAVAMALALPDSLPDRQLLQEIVFGVVLLTIAVQGSTAELVIHAAVGRDEEDRAPSPHGA